MSPNFTPPPILLIVYKRPHETRLVFEAIRKIKPKKLFIYGDGAKFEAPNDEAKIIEVKKIVSNVDWDCEVDIYFSPINLGSKITESSAINHFFSKVDCGIILEDDCLPNESFFYFCDYLLKKYYFDERVMHIGGYTLIPNHFSDDCSYYFSNIIHAWGWATWRRAWERYDVEMRDFPGRSFASHLSQIFGDREIAKYYFKNLLNTFRGKIDCWDYQWGYAIWKNHGICINPTTNLVSNIGFGDDGTYCKTDYNGTGNISTHELSKIVSPERIEVNQIFDKFEFNNFIKKKWSFYVKYYPSKILAILKTQLKTANFF